MAYLKIVENKYESIEDVTKLINYCYNPYKAKSGLWGEWGVNHNMIVEQFEIVQKCYYRQFGTLAHHFIVSFSPNAAIAPSLAYMIGWQLIEKLFYQYQMIFVVHEDKPHLHIHFVFNPVNLITGKKYDSGLVNFYNLKSYVDQL